MKTRYCVFTLVLISLGTSVFSQIEKGTFEIAVSGTAGVFSESHETTQITTDPSGTQIRKYKSSSDRESFLMMFFRPGYYIIDNLAVEPEIMWTAIEDDLPCLNLSGNIAYNFTTSNSSLTPYLFAGYGIANTIPFNRTLLFRATRELDIKYLNLGAGWKAHLLEHVALRVEYRYQKYTWKREYSYHYDSTTEKSTTSYDDNFHNIFVGVSFFVR